MDLEFLGKMFAEADDNRLKDCYTNTGGLLLDLNVEQRDFEQYLPILKRIKNIVLEREKEDNNYM